MPSKAFCTTCKRSWSGKSNLISDLDKLTQSVYLNEDGYLFRNPYWHMRMLPEPGYMEELMEDLHKEVVPALKGSFPEYQTQYFRLYGFRFIWFSSAQVILCRLPYSGRNWFEQATFFLPPTNEVEPNFSDLDMRLVARWTVAGYAQNKENGKFERKKAIYRQEIKPADYILQPGEELLSSNNEGSMLVKTANYYEGPDKEEPSDEELRFLKNSTEKLREWFQEYTHKKMEQRTCYTQEFVEKTKQFLKDYLPSGEWVTKLKIETYQEVRKLMLAEGNQLIRKIEKKIDKARQGYELYTIAGPLRKVNNERLLIPLKRDFIAEWWPRAFDLEGLWQFSTRPVTKKMIEDWENGRPLQSCVFCPSEAGMPSTRSDDFTFDGADLLSHKQLKGDKYKKIIIVTTAAYLANEARKFNEGIIEEGGQALSDVSVLKNMHASALTGRVELIENAIKTTEDKYMKETLKSYAQLLGQELGYRKEEKEKTQKDKGKLEKEKEELDERKARLENEIEQIKQDQGNLLEDKKKKEKELEKEIKLYEENIENQRKANMEYTRISGELNSLRTQISTNRTSLANLTDQGATVERVRLRNEQDRLQKESDELRRKLGIHETELSRLGGEININKEKIKQQREAIQDIHINLNNLNTGLNDLARKLGDLEKEYGDLKKNWDDISIKLINQERPEFLPREPTRSTPSSTSYTSVPRQQNFNVTITIDKSRGYGTNIRYYIRTELDLNLGEVGGERGQWVPADHRWEYVAREMVFKDIKNAEKTLKALELSQIRCRGGDFGGRSYDNNAYATATNTTTLLKEVIEKYKNNQHIDSDWRVDGGGFWVKRSS